MPSSTAFQITIVGGGIAGMTAAIALRGPGRQIVVLEQSRLHKEIGATISLQPNASKILEQTFGIGPFLEEARGMIDRGFRIFSSDGTMVNEVPLMNSRERFGGERMMYHRQDLHDALKRAATAELGAERGPPATIRTSAKAVSCDCESGTVTLADGSIVQSDLIVAADGIHSSLRASIIGHQVVPDPTGLSAYRLVIPRSDLRVRAPEFCAAIDPTAPYTSMMLAHSCRLIMSPARDGEIFGIVGLVPDERMDEDPNSAQSWNSRGDPEKMLHTFRDFPGWTKAAFADADDIGLWQLRDIDPLHNWTRGRAILIGDAAHVSQLLVENVSRPKDLKLTSNRPCFPRRVKVLLRASRMQKLWAPSCSPYLPVQVFHRSKILSPL